jgi:hypothetical protein
MNKQHINVSVLAIVMLAPPGVAQVGAPASGSAASARASSSLPAEAPGNVLALLAQIQAAARTTTADVSLLNIRKWKVPNEVKSDAEAKAQAIQRNLVVALPTIAAQLQASPDDFSANFKLYRNLGVLYDVMSSLAESAGAFGSKTEFEPLVTDLNRIDQARHSLGDRLEALASAKDAEISRLQNQVNAARAAATAQPKKVVVDEDEGGQKKPPKPPKKSSKKKTAATPTPQTSPSQPTNPQ